MKKTKDDEMMAQMLKELIPGAVDMYIHIFRVGKTAQAALKRLSKYVSKEDYDKFIRSQKSKNDYRDQF